MKSYAGWLRVRQFTVLVLGGLAVAGFFGCQPKSGDTPAKKSSQEHDHEHDHEHGDGHDHGDEHAHHHHDESGPHGGHFLDLAASDGSATYHAEWTHDDQTGLVAVYLMEMEGHAPVANPPTEVQIEIRTGKEPKTYTLAATDNLNDQPVQAAYSITDPALITALQIIVEGQEPLLRAQIGEKSFQAKFEEHKHEH